MSLGAGALLKPSAEESGHAQPNVVMPPSDTTPLHAASRAGNLILGLFNAESDGRTFMPIRFEH